MERKNILLWLGLLVTAYGLFPYEVESNLTIGVLVLGLAVVFGGYFWEDGYRFIK